MKINNTPPSFQRTPAWTQDAKAEAEIQWSPKSAYFWFNNILDSGLRRNDGKKLMGQQ